MVSRLYSINELSAEIKKGRSFSVAADEKLLEKLPEGNWIGGTIPYFMAEKGGIVTRENLFATELTDIAGHIECALLNEEALEDVYIRTPDNGFTCLILPAMSPVHFSYALNAANYTDFAFKPVIGWISGTHLFDLGKKTAKVVHGPTGGISEQHAVAMHVTLPPEKTCDIGMINIFKQGAGDTLEFLDDGFQAKRVLVNGVEKNFLEYVKLRRLNFKLPLVADSAGARINTSFQSMDPKSKTVKFYAPVFKGVSYKQAEPFEDYGYEFMKHIPAQSDQIILSFNCILNFLYSGLEGKQIGGITGPVTFGEIGYVLLNQTMVYLSVYTKETR